MKKELKKSGILSDDKSADKSADCRPTVGGVYVIAVLLMHIILSTLMLVRQICHLYFRHYSSNLKTRFFCARAVHFKREMKSVCIFWFVRV